MILASHTLMLLQRYGLPVSVALNRFGSSEIGYLPFGREEASLFFNVVAKRYECGSMIFDEQSVVREVAKRLCRATSVRSFAIALLLSSGAFVAFASLM